MQTFGVRVTAAYPGGSPDLPASADRVAGFTAQLRAMGLAIHDDVASLVRAVDAIFDTRRLPSDLEAALRDALGREAVFDLIATVGFYTVLGTLLLTYDVPLDDDVAAEMAENPL